MKVCQPTEVTRNGRQSASYHDRTVYDVHWWVVINLLFILFFESLFAVLLTSWLEPKYCCFHGLDLHSYSYFYEIRARWIHLISFSGFYVGRIFMSIHLVPSSPQDTQNRDIMWSPLSWWDVAVRLMHHKPSELRGVYMTPGRLESRPGASSFRFPFMALYLFTWYHHKMLYRRESPRREFTPVLVPGR